MWATPFPERHHRTCTVCDGSNLVLYPDSCWCLPSTRCNVPSLEHTGTFSGDPQGKEVRISLRLAQLKTGGGSGQRTLVPQGLASSITAPRLEARRGQKTRPLLSLACFPLCIYSDRFVKFKGNMVIDDCNWVSLFKKCSLL